MGTLLRFLVAALACFLVIWILEVAWYGVLMQATLSETDQAVQRAVPEPAYIALGYALLALGMTYLYTRFRSGQTPLPRGLEFGVLLGVFWSLPMTLVLQGVWQVERGIGVTLADAGFHLVEGALAGIAIALVFGRSLPLERS